MSGRNHSPKLNIFARLGVLRSLLMMTALTVVIAAPFADGSAHTDGWRLLPSVIAPTITMMLVFAIPLDITMAKIFMTDAKPEEANRLKFAVRIDILTLFAVLLAWTPFFINIL